MKTIQCIHMPTMAIILLFLSIGKLSANELVYSDDWQTIDFDVAGKWQIVKDSDGLYVVLDDEFETKNGPDLHILLSPKKAEDLTNSNTSKGALQVGLLKTKDNSTLFKKMSGAQKLKIPSGTDLSEYKSIAIHCVKYSHVWAAANLN